MSQIYKLTLSQKSGLLTELQSDTIFGHFCWRMKELSGEETLVEFLNFYKKRNPNPVFTISNSFFERDGKVFLSNPLLPINSKKESKTKDEKINEFLNYKDSKKRKFLTLEQFNFALNADYEKLYEAVVNDDTNQPKYIEDLRTSVEISRVTYSSKESQLFSYSPFYIQEEIINSSKQIFTETKTIIFIKIIDKNSFEKYNCKDLIKEVFNIGFGKKKSSGYGEFEVIDFKEYNEFKEPVDSNGFITLSNYLPSTDDNLTLKNSYYGLNIKYGKFGEELSLSENPFKRPIVFMIPGSCFIAEKKDFYGRCTKEKEISSLHENAIQNEIAFSLRMKINNFDR